MKSSPNTIRFMAPLRSVTLVKSQIADPAPCPVDEAAIRSAYEKGRIEGEKSLGEQLVQQRADMQELLDGIVASLRKTVSQVVGDTEQHMVALALGIAQKLVTDIPISVEMIEAAVRDALSQIEGTAEFHVRLHPADMDLLQKMESPMLAPASEDQPVRFHSSPEVTRGGCLVQTRFGIVDARRETKLDLLKRSLLG